MSFQKSPYGEYREDDSMISVNVSIKHNPMRFWPLPWGSLACLIGTMVDGVLCGESLQSGKYVKASFQALFALICASINGVQVSMLWHYWLMHRAKENE